MKTPDQILEEMANTFRERNKLYGNNYIHFGTVMKGLFPNGIVLATEEDFTKWGIFTMIISKMTRFSNSGLTHKDSVHDAGVYAAMLESLLQ